MLRRTKVSPRKQTDSPVVILHQALVNHHIEMMGGQ